jgi:hypothetical protein
MIGRNERAFLCLGLFPVFRAYIGQTTNTNKRDGRWEVGKWDDAEREKERERERERRDEFAPFLSILLYLRLTINFPSPAT